MQAIRQGQFSRSLLPKLYPKHLGHYAQAGRNPKTMEDSPSAPKVNLEDTGPQRVSEDKLQTLPKLSAAEFRVYNSMAEHMEYFVSHEAYEETPLL